MTYVANSIVTVDGKEYRPGDTIQTPADSKALGILVGIGYVIQRPCIDDAQQPAVQSAKAERPSVLAKLKAPLSQPCAEDRIRHRGKEER